jgi:hypothetical protein
VLGRNCWWTIASRLCSVLMAAVLISGLAGCGDRIKAEMPQALSGQAAKTQLAGQLSEVAPPSTIQQLSQFLDAYQPQVSIVSPQADEAIQDTKVAVKFQVQDLPIFKDPDLGLGPHLHVILDNQPYQAVYDINQPLVFDDLAPGTHTLRVFASRPWHESFKNEGAYAQTTFHIFTKSTDNNPDPALPLLTYSSPTGNYGAEPIMLDFYLTNAPLHLVARENPDDEIPDWRIRVTIDGESFVLDRWQPVYLKGFKPGKNWVQLEFLDEQGNPVKNVFNNTVRLINYEPKGNDTLSKLVRGELSAEEARGIVGPNYKAAPTVTPAPSPSPIPSPTVTPEPIPSATPLVEETPEAAPAPGSEMPTEEATPPVEVPATPEPDTSPTPSESPAAMEEVTSAEEATPPAPVLPKKPGFGGFFKRFRRPAATPTPSPELTQPEAAPTIAPEPPEQKSQPEASPTPSESPTSVEEPAPTIIESVPVRPIQPETPKVDSSLNPPQPSDSGLPPTLPEIVDTPASGSESEVLPNTPPETAEPKSAVTKPKLDLKEVFLSPPVPNPSPRIIQAPVDGASDIPSRFLKKSVPDVSTPPTSETPAANSTTTDVPLEAEAIPEDR